MTRERQYTDKIATTTTKTYQHYKDDNDHYNDTNDDNEKKITFAYGDSILYAEWKWGLLPGFTATGGKAQRRLDQPFTEG